MAFIPDEAVMRSGDVPPGAFRLYTYYCMRRDAASGTCYPSLQRAQADLGFKSYSYTSEMRSTLLKANWIEMTPGGEIKPLLGFQKPTERADEVSEKTEKVSEISEGGFGKNRTEFRKKPNIVSEISETLIKEEPAPLTSPSNQESVSSAPAREGWYSRAGDPPELVARIHDLHARYCEQVEDRGLMREDYALIKARLLEANFTDTQLAQAVVGFARSDFHRGKNFTAWKYVIGGADCNDRIRRWVADGQAEARPATQPRARASPARQSNVERGLDAVQDYIAEVRGRHGNRAG